MGRRAVLLTLVLLAGCRGFRCEAGIGWSMGIGADVHVSGLLHTGLLASGGLGGGTVYGKTTSIFYGAITVPFFHWQHNAWKMAELPNYEHTNLGVLPALTAGVAGDEVRAFPWAFEVSFAIPFLFFRIGIDPIGAAIDAVRSYMDEDAIELPAPPPESTVSAEPARTPESTHPVPSPEPEPR